MTLEAPRLIMWVTYTATAASHTRRPETIAMQRLARSRRSKICPIRKLKFVLHILFQIFFLRKLL